MMANKTFRVLGKKVLETPLTRTLHQATSRVAMAWKVLGQQGMPKVVSNREYWNRMAESGKVNWHISHHSQEQESEFWSSGIGVMESIVRASGLESIDDLPRGALVLDIGCGRGRIARAFAQKRSDFRVIGVDVSTSMIDNARVSNSSVPNLRFLSSEEASFPAIAAGSCDFVYSYVVFQHLPRHQVERILHDCRRVLAPSGELVFQLQGCDSPQELDPPWNDYRGVRKYTDRQVRHLLESSFENVVISGSGHDMFVACRPRE